MDKVSKYATVVLILLTSTMLLTVLSQNLIVQAQDDEATVVVLSSIGGTTNLGSGTYTYVDGQTITLIATPNSGFEFLYWIISGSYTPTHNQPPLIVPDIYVEDPNYVPDLPQPDRTGVDNLVLTQNRLDVICGYGYTFTYQPVFTPVSADVPQPDDQPPLGLPSETITILVVVLVIAVIIAVAFAAYIYMKHK